MGGFFSVALRNNRGWNRIGQEWAVYPTTIPQDRDLENSWQLTHHRAHSSVLDNGIVRLRGGAGSGEHQGLV